MNSQVSFPALDGLLAVSINRLAEITSLGRSFIYSEVRGGRLRLTKMGTRSVVLVIDAKSWLLASAQNQGRQA